MSAVEVSRRTALVTGSYKGIGAAIARDLAAAGMNVVVNYRSAQAAGRAEAYALELEREYGITACALQADVSSFEQVKELIGSVKEEFGSLDVLVNNAGKTADGLLMRMSEEQFDSVINANLKGTFNCMRHAVPLMVKQRYGRIINLASVVGERGNAGQCNYGASKAGIVGLTKSAAKELASRNITVNAIAPGFIETDMTAGLGEAAEEALKGRIAAKRLGEPSDVASLAAFLASEKASYITGQVISIDGGLSL